jgi:hypothetical protein
MKILTRFACLLAALSLSGCYPEERVWWSPKGDRAIVAVNDQLHLVTAEGEQGQPLLGSSSIKDWLIKTLDWLPDGTGFVCSRRRYVRTWAETQKLIPAKESDRIEEWLPMVLPTLEFQIARVKEPANITGLQGLIPGNDKALFEAGLRVLFERQRADVEKVLRKVPHGEGLLAELADPRGMFSVIELCVVRLEQPTDAALQGIAWGLLDPVFMPKVSPKHDVIAFLQTYDNRDAPYLKVMSLDGKTSLDIAQQISFGGFQWMPDGRTLVFTNALGQPGDSLQSIQQITVLQESGALMLPPYEVQPDGSQLRVEAADRLSEPRLLALALLPGRASLHPLPDGRILFASQPITLPAVEARPKLEPLLHLIAADGQSVSTVPTAPGDLPTDLNYMVVSPDGKRVAVVEGATDAVAVVEVDTGKTEIISEPHPDWSCETMPAWKSATELTFAALDDKTHAPCWMLWSVTGGKRSLSGRWPAADTHDWLTERKSSSSVKTAP